MAVEINSRDFPKGFVFGSATSALQIEGAYKEDSKSMTIWDDFSINGPENIVDGKNTTGGIDHYHRFKEDVKMMKHMGITAYRFSIAWSRILPGGRKSAGVNREGVKFYNDLIDCLKDNDIEPYVTIFHFDTPQCLQDSYQGFLSSQIVDDFVDYADICFFEFGDRVKHWITVNESWSIAHHGYVNQGFPPMHGCDVSDYIMQGATRHRMSVLLTRKSKPPLGDYSRECYTVAHNLILCHAYTADRYKKHYQRIQQGEIGVTNMTPWYYPRNKSSDLDKAATNRAIEFTLGWFVNPVTNGDYPPTMKQRVTGGRLPVFTEHQKRMLKNSCDFIGLNYYTANYISDAGDKPIPDPPTYYSDQQCFFWTEDINGKPIGPKAPGPDWLYRVPRGLFDYLVYAKATYNNPKIYITENGFGERNDKDKTVTKGCDDELRITYHREHLEQLLRAIGDEGQVNVQGYFWWSMFDNFELAEGYDVRFGMTYTDYDNNYGRYPKKSAIWYMNFLSQNPPLKKDVTDTDEVPPRSAKRIRGR